MCFPETPHRCPSQSQVWLVEKTVKKLIVVLSSVETGEVGRREGVWNIFMVS